MRYLHIFITIFVASSLFAADDPQISDFVNTISNACKQQDLQAIRDHFDDLDVSKENLNQATASWTAMMSGGYPEKGWTLTQISFVPIEILKHRISDQEKGNMPETTRQSIEKSEQEGIQIYNQMTQAFFQDGQYYKYNLKVFGFLLVTFTNGSSQTSRMFPIGYNPKGAIRFALLKETNG